MNKEKPWLMDNYISDYANWWRVSVETKSISFCFDGSLN